MSLHAPTNGATGRSSSSGGAMATPTKQPSLLPLLKHIEAFAKIVNVSQTLQLHEWNVESLQRALQWAQFLERGTRRYDAQQQLQLDALLRETFPAMALPSFAKGDVLTTHALQHASQHLTRSLLQSPFLSSHPIRSEMLLFILKQARDDASADDAPEPVDVSAVLTERTVLDQKAAALAQIAHTMSVGCKRIRVQVLDRTVSIAPLQSYTLRPKTLELVALAKTLQQNAVCARARATAVSETESYTKWLEDLKTQVQDASATSSSSSTPLDVLELVAVLVAVLAWSDEAMQTVRSDIYALVLESVVASAPQQLWRLDPWLCAMLAAQSTLIQTQYLRHLTAYGYLEPLAREFSVRVATLVLQSDALASDVTTALQRIDPLVLARHFGAGAEA